MQRTQSCCEVQTLPGQGKNKGNMCWGQISLTTLKALCHFSRILGSVWSFNNTYVHEFSQSPDSVFPLESAKGALSTSLLIATTQSTLRPLSHTLSYPHSYRRTHKHLHLPLHSVMNSHPYTLTCTFTNTLRPIHSHQPLVSQWVQDLPGQILLNVEGSWGPLSTS
jgi:hypothetical protein